jgi:hypothetical protein
MNQPAIQTGWNIVLFILAIEYHNMNLIISIHIPFDRCFLSHCWFLKSLSVTAYYRVDLHKSFLQKLVCFPVDITKLWLLIKLNTTLII